MTCGYRFRIYPNDTQRKQITNCFGCCRYIYNYFLAKRNELYISTNNFPTFSEHQKDLIELKENCEWLKDVQYYTLSMALQNMDIAYRKFLSRVTTNNETKHPRFKSKFDRKQSFKIRCTNANTKFQEKAIILPMLGKIKCRVSRDVYGRILSGTISRNSSGKFFVSLLITDMEKDYFLSTGKYVGIDLGLKSLVTTSDGDEYVNHRFVRKNLKRISKQDKRISKKIKRSKNHAKSITRISSMYERVINQRTDIIHKLTTQLIREYDVVCIENLCITDLFKQKNLARLKADASFGIVRDQLKYKSKWYGKEVIAIDRYFPSSQKCSSCGYIEKDLKKIDIREWKCSVCGIEHKRDINAAKNILYEGMKIYYS